MIRFRYCSELSMCLPLLVKAKPEIIVTGYTRAVNAHINWYLRDNAVSSKRHISGCSKLSLPQPHHQSRVGGCTQLWNTTMKYCHWNFHFLQHCHWTYFDMAEWFYTTTKLVPLSKITSVTLPCNQWRGSHGRPNFVIGMPAFKPQIYTSRSSWLSYRQGCNHKRRTLFITAWGLIESSYGLALAGWSDPF